MGFESSFRVEETTTLHLGYKNTTIRHLRQEKTTVLLNHSLSSSFIKWFIDYN
jgi:hypothetical protein